MRNLEIFYKIIEATTLYTHFFLQSHFSSRNASFSDMIYGSQQLHGKLHLDQTTKADILFV